MKYICVFCSSRGVDAKYTVPAVEFARLFTKAGYGFVWGGSDIGIMKLIAAVVEENGGRLVGVSVEHLKHLARTKADEMITTKDLGERKATMLARSDVLTVLPGGVGTLDELTEMIEFKALTLHDKPIVILNTENFYEGLKIQLQKMKVEGFIARPLDELVYFADTPEKALKYITTTLSPHS